MYIFASKISKMFGQVTKDCKFLKEYALKCIWDKNQMFSVDIQVLVITRMNPSYQHKEF